MREQRTKLRAKQMERRGLEHLDLPAALKGAALETRRGIVLSVAGRELRLIPPRRWFELLKHDLKAALNEASPWLVVQQVGPSRPRAHSLVLTPAGSTSALHAAVYRRSGRCIANGTVDRSGSRGIRFTLRLLCGSSRRRSVTQIRGSLSVHGRWQIELVRAEK